MTCRQTHESEGDGNTDEAIRNDTNRHELPLANEKKNAFTAVRHDDKPIDVRCLHSTTDFTIFLTNLPVLEPSTVQA